MSEYLALLRLERERRRLVDEFRHARANFVINAVLLAFVTTAYFVGSGPTVPIVPLIVLEAVFSLLWAGAARRYLTLLEELR